MTVALMTCCDPLRPRRPDPHFAEAAATAHDLGAEVALIDHDALAQGRAEEAVARVPRDLGPLWYRGWMLPSSRYAGLEAALAARGGTLATDAARYRRAHELPGWYEVFAPVTPRSVWLPAAPGTPLPPARLAELAAPLGPGPVIVKDYVKSRKHEWDEACYVPDAADADRLAAVVARFVALQEEYLTGGVVLRTFEEFVGAEARAWWLDGEVVEVTAHPDAEHAGGDSGAGSGAGPDVGAGLGGGRGAADAPASRAELDRLTPLVRELDCRFVTTDLARRADGALRVVEVGDGQVSGLPASANHRSLLTALLRPAGA